MFYYILTQRSLTYAQRGVRLLGAAGITATLLRTPREISSNGCGYGIKVSEKNLSKGVAALKNGNIPPVGVYRITDDGYEKVQL